MGLFDGLGGILKGAGGLIGKIPGVGSWVGPAIGLVGGLMEGNKSTGQANQMDAYTAYALQRQQELMKRLDPLFNQYLSTVDTPLGAGFNPASLNTGGNGFDPLSDFAMSDPFNSALANEQQRQMQAIDYNLGNTSAAAAAKAAAIRQGYRTRTAEQLKLMAGSRERRYNDYMQQEQMRRQAMMQALGPVFNGGNLAGAGIAQGQGQTYRNDANQMGASLAASVEALAKSGVFGPQGGKQGSQRGDSTTGNNKGNTNPAANQGMQAALGGGYPMTPGINPAAMGPAGMVNPLPGFDPITGQWRGYP